MIAADRAIDLVYARLSGDSTLSSLVGGRIGREPIIPVATGLARFPYVSFGIQANTPLGTLNATRVWENTVVRVSIWATMGTGQGWAAVRSIADRVGTLMQGYGGTTGGAQVVKFRLIETVDLIEDEVDGQRLHRVLLFRTEARAT